MLSKCIKTITEYSMLKKGDSVIVGLSGGADSCALLLVLCQLKSAFDLKITAVHINHCLRGEEADGDEAFAKALCDRLGVNFISERHNIEKIAVERGIGSEEAGREVRYDVFEKIKNQIGAEKIAVAHNLNDRAETVIMRLARGSGMKGIVGINPVRGNIIRPLIDCERSEIESFCRENGVDFKTDSTNNERLYTRNRVRLDVMPLLCDEVNSNAVKNIVKAAKSAEEENSFMEEETDKAFRGCLINTFEKNIVYLNVCNLKKCHSAIIKRVILKALVCVSGAEKDIYSKNVEDVYSLIFKGTGKSVSLPYGLKAEIVYDRLKIGTKKDSDKKEISYDLKFGEVCFIEETGKNVLISKKEEKIISKSGILCTKSFNYDTIKGSLTLRNRKSGDFLTLAHGGRKKLKDFFIDEKIPRDERDNILFVSSGSEVIWIPDMWVSKTHLTQKTENVIYIYIWEDA